MLIGDVTGYLRLIDEWTPTLKKAEQGMANFSEKWAGVGTKMIGIGAGLSAAVTAPIVALGASVLKLASAATESENLFEVSFGNMSKAARTWSEDLAESLNLNEYELRRTSATIFTMVSSMGLGEKAAFDMATGMTELAQDIASFYDLDPTEAFDKLRAGITGEAEPLKRLGILVDETTVKNAAYAHGIAKVGEELTQTQKVSARWVAILDQTTKAQGDMARTLDSPSNMLKALRAQFQQIGIELGTALLPMLKQFLELMQNNVVPAIKAAVQMFANLPPPLKLIIVGFTGLLAAAGPVLVVIGSLITAATTLAGVLGPTGALTLGVTKLTALLAGAGGLYTALILVGLAINEVIKAWGRMQQQETSRIVEEGNKMAEVFDRMKEHHTTMTRSVLKEQNEIYKGMRDAVTTAEANLKRAEQGTRTGLNPFGYVSKKTVDAARAELARARQDVKLFELSWGDVGRITEDVLGPDPPGLGGTLEELQAKLKEIHALNQKAFDNLPEMVMAGEQALFDFDEKTGELINTLGKWGSWQAKLNEELRDGTLATKDYTLGVKEITKAAKDYIDTIPMMGEAINTIEDAPEATGKSADILAAQIIDLASIMADAFSGMFDDINEDLNRLVQGAIDSYALFKDLQKTSGGMEGAIAGAAFGSSLGSLAATPSNYAQEAGAIGGAIGGAAGPIWGLVGAAAGTLIGTFINKGAKEALSSITISAESGEIAATITQAEGDLRKTMEGINDAILDAINGALDLIGGTGVAGSEGFGGLSIKIRGDVVSVFINGVTQRFKEIDEAIAFAVTEFFKVANVLGVSADIANAVKLAAEQAAGDLEAFSRDMEFIAAYQQIGTTELGRGLDSLKKEFDDLGKTATRLGLDTAKLTEEYENQAQAMKDAALLSFGNSLVDFVSQYYGEIAINEEFRQSLEAVNAGIRLAQLKLEYQALLAVGAISAELAAQADALFTMIEQTPIDFTGGGPGGRSAAAEERRREREAAQEARRAFREELELLEMATGGASSGVIDLVREIKALDDYLAEQAEAGVSATNQDRYRDLSLGQTLADIMGPVNEVLEPLSDADQVRQHYADVREQVTLIAKELGVAVQPYLDVIDAAEASDLAAITRDAADAEKELSDARREQLRSLQDLTTPDTIQRLRAIQEQMAAVVDAALKAGGAGNPDIQAAINAGNAAINKLSLDFLSSLTQMGVVVPGVAEALNEFNRQAALTTLNELLKGNFITQAQWDVATKGVNDYYDHVLTGTAAITQAAREFSDAAKEARDEATKSAISTWKNIFAVGAGSDDPVERLRGQIKEIRDTFYDSNFTRKLEFLKGIGADISGIKSINAADKLFESLIGDKEAQAIADAIADALEPLRDYFDDLRTNRPGLTTEARYGNTLEAFNAAIAAGDMTTALKFAQMLTGDVGVSQFGSSTEAFQDLVDYVVLKLGGTFDPEGPPADLLQQTIEDGVDIDRMAAETLSRLLEAQVRSETLADQRNRDLIAALDAYQQAGRVN